jgi:hypothetical protein
MQRFSLMIALVISFAAGFGLFSLAAMAWV